MRSALICVFLVLVVHEDRSRAENEEDFKPTPIPLSEWPRDKQENAGTFQEIIKTDVLPTVAAVPAHYWEDALRHSVYLTLVRDKIDQLIAQGDVISPDSRPDSSDSKGIDDHDLWEKIKTARFDRLKEEPIPPSDVAILARGRLLEDNEGYRFAEDDAFNKNCSDSSCTKSVKAFWSVKRMRQGESSGKYHYELTFSVTSNTNRKIKKPYENPVRTFTIKENSPTERPQKAYQHIGRPQRAIWVHKNISPQGPQGLLRRPSYSRSLDRLFSSLFSDEDSYEEHSPTSLRPKLKPQIYQHAKVGYVEDRELYHQKKLLPYSMTKPQSFRYTHPPIVPPPLTYVHHPYFSVDSSGNVLYPPQYSDNRHMPSTVIKTTRPAVLPTPITNNPLVRESTVEVPVKTKLHATEYTTKQPEVVTTYKIINHPKHSPMKISYFPDQIRPPVYNAPPGVFVTMDKKPFKPMPPLKHSHSHKPQKTLPPDFHPSPQVLDTQFPEEDSSADAAFRPITLDYTEQSNSKEGNDNSKKSNKNMRKTVATKKPTKKQENIKPHRVSTVPPEIITAVSEIIEDDSMEWANLLGSFSKTTPMASQRGTKENIDPRTTTTTEIAYTEDSSEHSSEDLSSSTTTTTTTTTTPKPKKRTRPPPKFKKPEKIKKLKRITTTTTTTIKPTRIYPFKKPSDDLIPQASSATLSGANSVWETKTKLAPNSTITSSTTPRPTTTIRQTTTSTSTTTSTWSTTVDTEQPVATTQPKSKNRFRQSTLMQKGTSVNHDKWSSSTYEKNRTITNSLRRKASNFQGYIPLSTPRSPEIEKNREDHKDHAYNDSNKETINTTKEQNIDILVKVPQTTQPTYEEQETNNEPEKSNESQTEWPHEDENVTEDFENEYILPTASNNHEVKSESVTLEYSPTTTEITVVVSPHSEAKNKSKCKKKKHNNLTTTEGALSTSTVTETTVTPTPTSIPITTTTNAVTQDIFAELFGGFTMDDATEEPKPERSSPPPDSNSSQSQKHEHFVHIDDDIKDFLHSLDEKSKHHVVDDKYNEEYDDDDDDDEDKDSPFNNDEENLDSRKFDDEYYDETPESQGQPFSLLELMAME